MEYASIILEFLKAWTQWVEAGAEEPHLVFTPRYGLCISLTLYCRRVKDMKNWECNLADYEFHKMMGYDHTPFNRGNQLSYGAERSQGKMHTNQQRRMWAYAKIRELEKGVNHGLCLLS